MKKNFTILLILILAIGTSIFADEKVEELTMLNDVGPKVTNPPVVDDVGDIIFDIDVQAITGDDQCLGCEYVPPYLWVTGGGGTGGGVENSLYKIDPVAGTLEATYLQNTTSAWGMRDLCYDPVVDLLYAGDDNGFYSIDPADGTVTTVFTGAIGACIRALAYDGTNFWTKSFAGDLYEFDIAGNIINSYADPLSTYGMAYDSFENCLWLFAAPTTFYQYDLSGASTGTSYALVLPNGGIIGGAFYEEGGLVSGKTVLGCLGQGTPDAVYAMELRDVASQAYPLPFTEGFEGGVMPDDWTQEYVVNTLDWIYDTGGHSGHPASAHSGTYNALLYESGYNGTTTKLITPQIDMSTANDVELTFWHTQDDWLGDQDFLRVYYKNSAGGAWTLLAEYLGNIDVWTEEIITLPDLSGDYYVAFEGFLDYGYGVCVDDISIVGTGTTLDPPSNVAVDGNSGIVTWDPPPVTIYTDDFESYTAGEYLAVQSADWTTWSNQPGTAEDGYVSADYALSGTNSVKVDGTTDLVLIMEDYTSGRYSVDVNLYIPTGYCGYYNLQKTSTPGTEWGIQTMFDVDGIASIDGDGAAACTFPFNFDTWLNFVIIVDLDDDLCEFYFDGTLMHSYQWTLGCFGSGTLTSLGGMNMFAWSSTGNSPLYYFDDILFTETYEEPVRDLIGYNLYLDEVWQDEVGIDVFSYEYTGLTPYDTYTAGVSALYDEGESEIIEVDFIYTPVLEFDPPENLVATVVNYNEVDLVWEAPGGTTGGEFLHHTGYDNNGIGTGAAADFICAARFDAVELSEYYGYCAITQVKVHIRTDDFNYVHIKVWEGGSIGNPGTEVYDADITGDVLIEDWTVHTLTTPVPLVAGNEYWIGYDIHATFDHPCSVDSGPMVPDKGAWIYFSGTWSTLFSMALDYNWCITGVATPTDCFAIKAPVNNERVTISEMRPMLISESPLKAKFTRGRRTNTSYVSRDDRYLYGYKVYRNAVEIAYIEDPAILVYSDDEGLDAGDYEYYVTAVYEAPAGESVPSNIEPVTITLPPPENAEASCTNPPNVFVGWDAPPVPTRDLVHYRVYQDGTLVGDDIPVLYFIHTGVEPGDYIYNVTAVYDGEWESEFSNDAPVTVPTGVGDNLLPIKTELTGNYPNPFNPTTTINFGLKEAGDVTIMVYNIKGEKVRTLIDGQLEAKYHSIVWDGKDNTGRNVSSGVYFYKMKAEKYSSTKKMILMK